MISCITEVLNTRGTCAKPRGGYRNFVRGGTVNKSYKKVGVDPQKGVGAGGGYAPSRAKRGSF